MKCSLWSRWSRNCQIYLADSPRPYLLSRTKFDVNLPNKFGNYVRRKYFSHIPATNWSRNCQIYLADSPCPYLLIRIKFDVNLPNKFSNYVGRKYSSHIPTRACIKNSRYSTKCLPLYPIF